MHTILLVAFVIVGVADGIYQAVRIHQLTNRVAELESLPTIKEELKRANADKRFERYWHENIAAKPQP
jgi:hypothetical protein